MIMFLHDCFGRTKQTYLDGLVVIIRDLLPKWPVTPREGFARERGDLKIVNPSSNPGLIESNPGFFFNPMSSKLALNQLLERNYPIFKSSNHHISTLTH